jgi:hypothetical protein
MEHAIDVEQDALNLVEDHYFTAPAAVSSRGC